MIQRSFTPSTFDTATESTGDAAPTGIWSYTVPANTIIQPLAMIAVITTDATVINRKVFISAGAVGALTIQSAPAIAQTAGQTRTYAICRVEVPAFADTDLEAIYFAMPDDVFLSPGEIILLDCLNFQAGDSLLSTTLRYRRWIIE